MKKLTRKEREKLQRREAIVDAAEEVIRERGFEVCTMDEIAERSEFSKGTLYLYFENKTALYIAICERGSRKLNRQFAEVLSSDDSGIGLVRKLGDVYLKFVREHPVYFNAFAHYESLQDEGFLAENPIAKKCEEHASEALTYILRCLQVGMQDGSVDDSYDPKVLALLIWACSRGVVQIAELKSRGHHFSLMDDLEVGPESLVPSLIRLLEEGMKGKPNGESDD